MHYHIFMLSMCPCTQQVLRTPLPKRIEALEKLIALMKPSQNVLKSLKSDRFLNNDLVVWDPADKQLLEYISDGRMRCLVCSEEHCFPSQERWVLHVLSKKHHNNCKQILKADATAAAQDLLKSSTTNVTHGDQVVEMIKDYASQYCVAKSLPFTAASMAMECVCAAVSTIVTGGISMQAISALEKAGHKHEVTHVL